MQPIPIAKVYVYDYDDSGKIYQKTVCTTDMVGDIPWHCPHQLALSVDVDIAAHYIHDGAPVRRHVMPVVQSGAALTGLPAHCTVTINGASYDVDDGCFEYVTPLPGSYPVSVEAWPYLTWEGVIDIEG